jgi:hypothetical protein
MYASLDDQPCESYPETLESSDVHVFIHIERIGLLREIVGANKPQCPSTLYGLADPCQPTFLAAHPTQPLTRPPPQSLWQ